MINIHFVGNNHSFSKLKLETKTGHGLCHFKMQNVFNRSLDGARNLLYLSAPAKVGCKNWFTDAQPKCSGRRYQFMSFGFLIWPQWNREKYVPHFIKRANLLLISCVPIFGGENFWTFFNRHYWTVTFKKMFRLRVQFANWEFVLNNLSLKAFFEKPFKQNKFLKKYT